MSQLLTHWKKPPCVVYKRNLKKKKKRRCAACRLNNNLCHVLKWIGPYTRVCQTGDKCTSVRKYYDYTLGYKFILSTSLSYIILTSKPWPCKCFANLFLLKERKLSLTEGKKNLVCLCKDQPCTSVILKTIRNI